MFFFAGTPKFAAQALRKVSELGWESLRIINHISGSVPVLKPIGLDKAKGVISVSYYKATTDPAWNEGVSRDLRQVFDRRRF